MNFTTIQANRSTLYKDRIIKIINMKLSSNEYTNISENKEIIRNDNFHS